MRIALVASEGVPFSKTGGLADVAGRPAQGSGRRWARRRGNPAALPDDQTRQGSPNCKSLTLPLSHGFKYASIQEGGESAGVRFLLVECPELFDREGLYQVNGEDHLDNYVRFAGFSMAALEFLKRAGHAA